MDKCIRYVHQTVPPGFCSIVIILLHTHTHNYPPSITANTMNTGARTSTGQRVTAFVIVSPRHSRAPIYTLKSEHIFCTQIGTADDESKDLLMDKVSGSKYE